MRFRALDAAGAELLLEYYYSVGGGFVLSEREADAGPGRPPNVAVPYPFASAEELLTLCRTHGRPIAELDPGEREGLARRGRDPRRAAAPSGRPWKARSSAAAAAPACCPAGSRSAAARRPCTPS